ncbi:MAG TPA: radical SAM family heme chaperone HemW, partial [Candidatus Omnitrophota bacterium]|nr:radical SAM family heme chaperone HemW [Candidatus Omnitrophota bacterium]
DLFDTELLTNKKLFAVISSNFSVTPGAEITFEANPATFDHDKAGLMFDCGINRVSLGVQSLNDNYLKFLGRPHTSQDARSAFGLLRKVGFKNINLDLIYSLPGQAKKDMEEDLTGLIDLCSEHLSLYTLSVSPGSKFHNMKVELPVADAQGEHYLYISQLLKRKGYVHYEVSNFAKPGFECRHNKNYWQGGNYIGLGAAAHSHLEGRRFWNIEDIQEYIRAIGEKTNAILGEEILSEEKRFMETLLIGLRLSEGVDVSDLEERFEAKLPKDKEKTISDFIEQGLLEEEGGRLKATMTGMVVLDEICSRLI